MYEIGRVCMKIAGRDAGKRCIVVDILDQKTVLIDGETRRRKCNTSHLEPLPEVLKVKKNASHEEVVKVFKEFGVEIKDRKKKTLGTKPTKQRKTKVTSSEKKEAKPKKAPKKKE